MAAEDIAAISFDADGTLFDFDTVMRRALQEALDELQSRFPVATSLGVDALIQHRNDAAHAMRGMMASMEDIRLAGFKRTLASIGIVDDRFAIELTDLFLSCRFTMITLYDDVLPALAALRGHYTLGVLSNGNSYPERCGLDGWFSFGVYAHDYGFEKPDQRLFEIMLAQTGCSPSQVLHVGDSLRNDVIGAQRSGIRAVWLNRTGEQPWAHVHPDFEIASLMDLASICANGSRNSSRNR